MKWGLIIANCFHVGRRFKRLSGLPCSLLPAQNLAIKVHHLAKVCLQGNVWQWAENQGNFPRQLGGKRKEAMDNSKTQSGSLQVLQEPRKGPLQPSPFLFLLLIPFTLNSHCYYFWGNKTLLFFFFSSHFQQDSLRLIEKTYNVILSGPLINISSSYVSGVESLRKSNQSHNI